MDSPPSQKTVFCAFRAFPEGITLDSGIPNAFDVWKQAKDGGYNPSADIEKLPSLDFPLAVMCDAGMLASFAFSWMGHSTRYQRMLVLDHGARLVFSVVGSDKKLYLEHDRATKKATAWFLGDDDMFSDEFASHVADFALFTTLPVVHTAEEYNATRTIDARGISWKWTPRNDEPHNACSCLEVTRKDDGDTYGGGMLWGTDWQGLPDWEADWHMKVLTQPSGCP